MSPKVITGPSAEPITLAEAKVHLRADGTDEDEYITSLIVAAREGAEHLTGRALMPQTLELALDNFCDVVKIPMPPLVSITSVKYLDEAGDLQTMAAGDYLLDDYSEPARIKPAYGTAWPATRKQPNAVLIRYEAGYANAAAVPQQIKNWMLFQIGTMYANRESVVTGISVAVVPEVDRLLDKTRLRTVY